MNVFLGLFLSWEKLLFMKLVWEKLIAVARRLMSDRGTLTAACGSRKISTYVRGKLWTSSISASPLFMLNRGSYGNFHFSLELLLPVFWNSYAWTMFYVFDLLDEENSLWMSPPSEFKRIVTTRICCLHTHSNLCRNSLRFIDGWQITIESLCQRIFFHHARAYFDWHSWIISGFDFIAKRALKASSWGWANTSAWEWNDKERDERMRGMVMRRITIFESNLWYPYE